MEMPKRGRLGGVICGLLALSACATASVVASPLSIEFGHDVYLTDTYLDAEPGARCGIPSFAPGGVEAGATLPDGTWFRVVAVGGDGVTPETVVLERGVEAQPTQLTMRLDSEEGIVRLQDAGRRDAWRINHAWADWMRELGDDLRSLDCAQPE